jgi:hypothetical protein
MLLSANLHGKLREVGIAGCKSKDNIKVDIKEIMY